VVAWIHVGLLESNPQRPTIPQVVVQVPLAYIDLCGDHGHGHLCCDRVADGAVDTVDVHVAFYINIKMMLI
jgi:hypothetical protein